MTTIDDQQPPSDPDGLQLSDLVDRLHAYGRRVEDELRSATDRANSAEAHLEALRADHASLQDHVSGLQDRVAAHELASAHAADIVSAARAEGEQMRTKVAAELAEERRAMRHREQTFVDALRTYLGDIEQAQSSLLQIARRALGGVSDADTNGTGALPEGIGVGAWPSAPPDALPGSTDHPDRSGADPAGGHRHDAAAEGSALTPLPSNRVWGAPSDETTHATSAGSSAAAPINDVDLTDHVDLTDPVDLTDSVDQVASVDQGATGGDEGGEPVSGEHQLIDDQNRLDLLRLRSSRRLFGSDRGAVG